jgi:radical SAM superfamily enzyme YgiQ (UPF0313 family)
MPWSPPGLAMNALLVYPEFPDTFWSFKYALKFIRKKASFPPLGLLTVAAMLPPEWSLRLVDLNTHALTADDLAWADLAFISAMAVQRPSAETIIARCRDVGVRVVAGGPLFTAQRERFPQVDHLVLNEAELTLPAFLEDLARGKAGRVYTSSEFADVRATPAPRWELVRMASYVSMPVQYSRGCPYDCEFCDVTALFGHRPRTKSAAQIIGELERLCARGWRGPVFFVDDNLIGNKRSLKSELLPALIAWRKGRRGLRFNTEVSINLADDDELMRLMVAAGFDTVFVGIETPDADSLAECGKKQNLHRDLVADTKRMQRAGIEVQGGFILGFDSDTLGTVGRLRDFIQTSGIVTAMVGLLQAAPGTRLYERMRRAGRLLDAASGDNVDGTTNIVPALGLETLRKAYRDLLRHLYSPQAYYRRVRTFLREYRQPKIRGRVDGAFLVQQALAFLRSTYRLGFVGRERVHYWGLFWWTLFRRPRALPLAITLAVYGYHFRMISELHVQ